MSDVYIYADASLTQTGRLIAPELSTATERHKVEFPVPDLQPANLLSEMHRQNASGIVIGLSRGWPGLGNLRFVGRMLRSGTKIFFHWPAENAVEVVDSDRLRGYWHLWYVASAHEYLLRRFRGDVSPARFVDRQLRHVRDLTGQASPTRPKTQLSVDGNFRISGTGIYLRTDFWHPISSGGSYGHTCYVAKAPAGIARMPRRD